MTDAATDKPNPDMPPEVEQREPPLFQNGELVENDPPSVEQDTALILQDVVDFLHHHFPNQGAPGVPRTAPDPDPADEGKV
jgi:hypothetical protein